MMGGSEQQNALKEKPRDKGRPWVGAAEPTGPTLDSKEQNVSLKSRLAGLYKSIKEKGNHF